MDIPGFLRQHEPVRIERFGALEIGLFGWAVVVIFVAAFVAGRDDVAVMRQAIEQRRRHLRIVEHARPFE